MVGVGLRGRRRRSAPARPRGRRARRGRATVVPSGSSTSTGLPSCDAAGVAGRRPRTSPRGASTVVDEHAAADAAPPTVRLHARRRAAPGPGRKTTAPSSTAARLLLVRLLLPALDGVLRGVVELRVDGRSPCRGRSPGPRGSAPAGGRRRPSSIPSSQRAPGRLAAREAEHRPGVDAVEHGAAARRRCPPRPPTSACPGGGWRRRARRCSRACRRLLARDQVAALDLGRGTAVVLPVAGRAAVAGRGSWTGAGRSDGPPPAVGGERAVPGDRAAGHGQADHEGAGRAGAAMRASSRVASLPPSRPSSRVRRAGAASHAFCAFWNVGSSGSMPSSPGR